MSILGSMLTGKQKCLNCGQSSSANRGQGNWEPLGMFSGWPAPGSRRALLKCLKCGAGLVIAVLGSNRMIAPEELACMERQRDRDLGV